MQGDKNNPFYNQSGYADPTAYHAMKTVMQEEKEEQELETKVHNLVKVLKLIVKWAGFELIGRIQIRDKKTGKEFK
jgi:hypothetical protein